MCKRQSWGDVDIFLIDFGAVANPQKRSGGSTVAGTFGYMAPEQLLGDVAIQSDYYALGATALHCLTGVVPYEIESDGFNLKFKEVIQQKAPNTSVFMIELLDNLLAPEIEKRPKDAAHLLYQIQQVIKGESPNADHPKQSLNLVHERGDHIISSTPGDDWPVVPGMIRCTNTIYKDKTIPVSVFEYTFVAGNMTYVGFDEIHNSPKNLKYPIKCEVKYDPYDPRINTIAKYPEGWI